MIAINNMTARWNCLISSGRKIKTRKPEWFAGFIWYAQRDSNPRHAV